MLIILPMNRIGSAHDMKILPQRFTATAIIRSRTNSYLSIRSCQYEATWTNVLFLLTRQSNRQQRPRRRQKGMCFGVDWTTTSRDREVETDELTIN
jgi:hypothetical protein